MGRFHLVSSSEKYSLSHQERNSGGRDLILSADQKAEKKNHQHLIGFVFFSVRSCSLENAPPLGRDQVFFLQLNASQLSLNPISYSRDQALQMYWVSQEEGVWSLRAVSGNAVLWESMCVWLSTHSLNIVLWVIWKLHGTAMKHCRNVIGLRI